MKLQLIRTVDILNKYFNKKKIEISADEREMLVSIPEELNEVEASLNLMLKNIKNIDKNEDKEVLTNLSKIYKIVREYSSCIQDAQELLNKVENTND